MKKFLLDVNVSPRTGAFLRETLAFDVVHAGELVPPGAPDDDVVAVAKDQKRVIITLDPDSGELYHVRERVVLG